MIYPYLQYCNIVWASTYPTNLKRIVVLQKRIIRVMNNSKFDAHTDPIFRDLHVIKFHDICKMKTGQFVYLARSRLLPKLFNELFHTSDKHIYNTRSSKDYLIIPYCRTKLRQFAVCYHGSKYYNSLPDDLKNSGSVSIFNKKLKRYLFSEYGHSSDT